MTWRPFVRFMTVASVVVAAPAAMAPAVASAAQPEPTYERTAAPWCGKSVWSSGKKPTLKLGSDLKKVKKVVTNIDDATDAATFVFAVVSGGTVAAPAVVIKGVAKLGVRRIVRVLDNLVDDLAKVNKRRAGVRVKINCVAGIVPYPSFSIYT